MEQIAVIGLGFGDEGKGRVVDYLCSTREDSLVIRFSGGQQAGHTVVREGVRHVFSNFGSGTLLGVPTYISRFCTVDPIGIIKEMRKLHDSGITPRLYIDERCPVTTPYEKILNKQLDYDNGTVGVGVGPTWQREEDYFSLVFSDIYYPSVMDIKLSMIRKYYGLSVDLDDFLNAVNEIVKANNVFSSPYIPSGDYDDMIFEGSQGLMLDKNIGFFPHVTRSNVGLQNILQLTPVISKVYFVTRAYQTRHGNGPMTNEHIPHFIYPNPNETNVLNKFQGQFRRTLLDVDLLKYALRRGESRHYNSTLVITCMDHIVDDMRFTHGGEVWSFNSEDDFVKGISDVLGIRNVLLSRGDSGPLEQFKG